MKKIGLLVILMMILVAPFAVFAEEEGDKKDTKIDLKSLIMKLGIMKIMQN